MRFDVYHHLVFEVNQVDEIFNRLQQLEERIMHRIDELLQKVTEQGTVVDGVVTLLEQLKAGLAEQGPAEEKVAAAIQMIDEQKEKMAAAVVANTPSEE